MAEGKKNISDVVRNEYEAVLVAAKLSRQINNNRLAAKEKLNPEDYSKLDQRKVTTAALTEIIEGRVKYERKKPTEEEETFDLT